MKNLFFLLASFAVLSACSKEAPALRDGEATDVERVEIDFRIAGVGTKLAGPAADLKTNEDAVNYIQIFSFNDNGSVDAFSNRIDVRNSAEKVVTLACAFGTKTIYALVNAPSVNNVSSSNDLLAITSDLSNNSPNSFVMIGSKSITVNSNNARSTVSVNVKRLVARLGIKKITRDFSESYNNFKIEAVSVKHAARNTNYALTAAPSGWYNDTQNHRIYFNGQQAAGHEYDRVNSQNVVTLLTDYAINYPLADSASYETENYFYVYPNDGSVKSTLLTIEVSYTTGNTTNYRYYPISLPENVSIESNKTYTIGEVKLTRIGGTKDDADEIVFEVVVEDWEVGAEWDVEY